jgi:Domain of unknown function (DUF4167)
MRQSQQNRRSRGRNNNNRKSQNPLTRSYESNGPDVKIRGTPSHIAEKYVTMARDALSSGDPVLAENYLQHAEHYNRIIMTYREQQGSHQNDQANQPSAATSRHRNPGDPIDDENGADESTEAGRAEASPPGSEPQPSLPRSEATGDEQPRPRRRSSANRDRGEQSSGDGERAGAERPAAQERQSSRGPRNNRRSRYSRTDDQPEFLKRPVRRPRASSDDEAPAEAPPAAAAAAASDEAAE